MYHPKTPPLPSVAERLAAPAQPTERKPDTLRIDFAGDIPVIWLFEELAVIGLVISNNLQTGHLKAELSPRMREILYQRITDALNSPSEVARRRMLEAGMEP